jgi:hypothetical protein
MDKMEKEINFEDILIAPSISARGEPRIAANADTFHDDLLVRTAKDYVPTPQEERVLRDLVSVRRFLLV